MTLSLPLTSAFRCQQRMFFEVSSVTEGRAVGRMGAAVALKTTFAPGVFEGILSFMDDSSQVAVCGADTSDIANMEDFVGFVVDPYTRTNNCCIQVLELYEGSIRDEWWLALSAM